LILWQTTRPVAVLLVALATALLAALGASRLTLKTSFGELLPQGKESVIVAEQANARLSSASTLTIVAEADSPEGLERFVDALAPELRALGPELVGSVDDGVKAMTAFLEKHRLLYAPLEDVQKAHDAILERYEYEVALRAGSLLDETDAPAPITAESLRARLGEEKAKAQGEAQFPRGYYLEPSGKMIAVLVRTPISGGDTERGRVFMERVEEVVARVDPKRFDSSMTVRYTGDFITTREEYAQIKGDLGEVGLAGVLMILGSVYLFYLRLRPLACMAVTVCIGVLWTFGVAYLAIGHLNSSTGFLVSIVVGNGINFGIIYMTRYLQARRTEQVGDSIRIAHRETWVSTLAAAGAAMVAYGSLIVTDFRGFKHFGAIGGAGMILCWIATYLFMPALLVVFERVWPLGTETGLAARLRGAYGRLFAWLVTRFPRAIAVSGLLMGIAATALAVHYFASDPMEYDMANIRSETKTATGTRQLSQRVEKIVGRQGQDGLAILVDRLEQVKPLKAKLDERRASAPEAKKPFDKVVTIFDLIPADQEKKIGLLAEVRDRLERARRRGFIPDTDWNEVNEHLPSDVRPIGIDDLPEQMARAFTEKDGTRGRLVYIVPTSGRSVWDARYLIEWADSFRSTTLPDGSVVKGSGRSVIFADLILTVVEDAPKAITVSLLGTMLIILIAFRARRGAWIVMATLLLGLTWMIATMALWGSKLTMEGGLELEGIKLNFLNFVALPISIGVGADYAVNVRQRYQLLGRGKMRQVIQETGGAVVLCSMTTVLGYLALSFSVNKAIVSFGVTAATGEIACLLAGVLVLPAWLEWRDRRAIARAAAARDFTREEPLRSTTSPSDKVK
jgi:predicted RND superfamily exporter protein